MSEPLYMCECGALVDVSLKAIERHEQTKWHGAAIEAALRRYPPLADARQRWLWEEP